MNAIHVMLIAVPFCAATAQVGAPRRMAGDSLLQAGIRLQGEGRLSEAVATLRLAREGEATGPIAFQLGTALALVNDFTRARSSLEEAVRLEPARTGYRYQLARLLVQIGSPAEGAAQYEQIIALDSSYTPALFQLGLLEYERRQYASAADRFGRIIRQSPRDFLAHHYRGAALTSLGLPDSARASLAASLSLNPEYVPGLALLASLYYARSEVTEALRLYTTASRLRPENADLHYRKGLCEERLDRYREALESFANAIARDSSHVHAFAHLGQVWFQLGKYDSSIASYERALALEEENPSIHVNIALAWERRDSIDRAAASLRRAVQAHLPEEIAKIYTQLAAVYFNAHRYREAERAYVQALQIEPGNLVAMFFIAVTQDQMNRWPQAVRSYQRFLAAAKPGGTMGEKISDARRRVGSLETALQKKTSNDRKKR